MAKQTPTPSPPAVTNNRSLSAGEMAVAIELVKGLTEIVKAYSFSIKVDAILKACEQDHSMKMAKVEALISIFREFKNEMTPVVKDQYFLKMLDLLTVTGGAPGLLSQLETLR